MKVTVQQMDDTIIAWSKTFPKPVQRLGQFLMNELVPLEKDSEIFYCEDVGQCGRLFNERFVEKKSET
jgi:hypothetical protein